VTLVLNVGPAPAGPAFPGHNGAIVFVRTVFDPGSNSRQELFRIEPNGTGEDRLTMDDNWDQQPTWSPDGTKIAFARWDVLRAEPADLYGERGRNRHEANYIRQ
jgi:Tol biopolymer transport system component